MKNAKVVLGLTLLGFFVGGCQDTKRALGFTKSIPDENTVIERAPLTVPENLELRPPRTGDAEESWDATQKARETLVGSTQKSKELSSAEKALLMKAGIESSDPNIRDQLNSSPAKIEKSDVLDAEKESEKLKKKAESTPEEEAKEAKAE